MELKEKELVALDLLKQAVELHGQFVKTFKEYGFTFIRLSNIEQLKPVFVCSSEGVEYAFSVDEIEINGKVTIADFGSLLDLREFIFNY